MINYSSGTPLGDWVFNLPNITDILAQTTAIAQAFCSLTGMEIKETYYDAEPATGEGARHYVLVGYENEPPLLYFGATYRHSTYWNRRFEYGPVVTEVQSDSSLKYLPMAWYVNNSATSSDDYLLTQADYLTSSDYQMRYAFAYSFVNGTGTRRFSMAYAKADNGAIAFTLLTGRTVDQINNDSFMLILPITDGTSTKHVFFAPWCNGSRTSYFLLPSANDALGIVGYKVGDRMGTRIISMPTFVTADYSPDSGSSQMASGFIKRGEAAMVTHRIYLPQSSNENWYVPEGTIYECLQINQMPNVGMITQYGNKRLMCFNWLSSGGFRLCLNVDAT